MAQDDKDFLNMSDEEMMNAPMPKDVVPVSQPAEKEVNDEEPSSDEKQAAQKEEGLLNQEDATEDSDADQANEIVDNNSKPDSKSDNTAASEPDLKPETGNETEKVEEVKPEAEASDIDYKAAYEQLLAPFKANGREIAVKGVDDAIALMQMGANYNKKMAALKPNLKLMKLLENNGLLSEEKLSYLIDLDKKSPEAISKLVKDSGLDPLDLDASKAGDYKPSKHTVDDREIELDTVLDELQGTPTYNQTLNIVSNVWDGASKQVIANSPQLLKVINSHVQSGIYDLISKEIESERVFGRLDGLSDIEAYRQVGDAIQARGGFNHLGTSEKPQAKPVVIQPKPKEVGKDDEKLREKKRAASSTKPVVSAAVKSDFNPLSLSDDAFSKLVNDKYL